MKVVDIDQNRWGSKKSYPGYSKLYPQLYKYFEPLIISNTTDIIFDFVSRTIQIEISNIIKRLK